MAAIIIITITIVVIMINIIVIVIIIVIIIVITIIKLIIPGLLLPEEIKGGGDFYLTAVVEHVQREEEEVENTENKDLEITEI